MPEIATIGLDIAKNVFQLHGVDRSGKIVLRKALRRSQVPGFFSTLPPCLIGVEACATAHHWARTLMAFGHDVRLIPPAYVKPYLRRQKNDAADAAAICEAVDALRPGQEPAAAKHPHDAWSSRSPDRTPDGPDQCSARSLRGAGHRGGPGRSQHAPTDCPYPG